MERVIGVESARAKLGELVGELGQGPLFLTKRGAKVAVIVSTEEYEQLKADAAKAARARLRKHLIPIRASVKKAGLPESIVDEAIKEARRSADR